MTNARSVGTMNRREHKDQTFLLMALILSELGTCDRKQVGAIITREGRAVSWGFNGAPPGAPHCEENEHGWLGTDEHLENLHPEAGAGEAHWQAARLAADRGCTNATHAEANALAFAARQGISTEGGTCYVTVSPCEVCARLLIAAGIREIIYAEEYRDRRGIEILRGAGITCLHRDSDGRLVGELGEVRRIHT